MSQYKKPFQFFSAKTKSQILLTYLMATGHLHNQISKISQNTMLCLKAADLYLKKSRQFKN